MAIKKKTLETCHDFSGSRASKLNERRDSDQPGWCLKDEMTPENSNYMLSLVHWNQRRILTIQPVRLHNRLMHNNSTSNRYITGAALITIVVLVSQ